MAKKDVPGLEPRGFRWVIAGRLAVSERIGGYGFQHRRVRREEEIAWLTEKGINTVLTLLPPSQNAAAYDEAQFRVVCHSIEGSPGEIDDIEGAFAAMDEALNVRGASVLLHRDTIDETVGGLLAGYLVHSGLVNDPIIATSVIQEILGRPLGPEARSLIPVP
ncbi:MAG TPA: hypothetical protein VFD97_02165 [Acidimicrobiia bacterium]|nr:hypothetical protein [Acidimicrobiia bacterium]